VEDPLDSTLALEFFNDSGQYEISVVEHTARFATQLTVDEWRHKLLGEEADVAKGKEEALRTREEVAADEEEHGMPLPTAAFTFDSPTIAPVSPSQSANFDAGQFACATFNFGAKPAVEGADSTGIFTFGTENPFPSTPTLASASTPAPSQQVPTRPASAAAAATNDGTVDGTVEYK
jgi:hypothetical protein